MPAEEQLGGPYLELMGRLDQTAGVNAIGSVVASNAQITGNRYHVWYGPEPVKLDQLRSCV